MTHWRVQPKHSLARQAHSPAYTPAEVAQACNDDPRFRTAAPESPADIAGLMVTAAFQTALKRIASVNVPVQLGALVSAVYACRVEQRRLPKRPA